MAFPHWFYKNCFLLTCRDETKSYFSCFFVLSGGVKREKADVVCITVLNVVVNWSIFRLQNAMHARAVDYLLRLKNSRSYVKSWDRALSLQRSNGGKNGKITWSGGSARKSRLRIMQSVWIICVGNGLFFMWKWCIILRQVVTTQSSFICWIDVLAGRRIVVWLVQ